MPARRVSHDITPWYQTASRNARFLGSWVEAIEPKHLGSTPSWRHSLAGAEVARVVRFLPHGQSPPEGRASAHRSGAQGGREGLADIT